jgi:hypothetical protein
MLVKPTSSPQITTIFGLALVLDLAISISFRWSGGFERAHWSSMSDRKWVS